MNISLITGDRLLPKRTAVLYAMDSINFKENVDFDLHTLENDYNRNDIIHFNPIFSERQKNINSRWEHVLSSIRNSKMNHIVIITSCYTETDSGLELSFPLKIFNELIELVSQNQGSINIGCLTDDVYAETSKRSSNLLRNLTIRQLEWTFSQYLNDLGEIKAKSKIFFVSLHQPISNLANIISRINLRAIYLCYPINYFRRNPLSPLKTAIEQLKVQLSKSGLIIYDPMCIDEEVLISTTLGERDEESLKIRKEDRWVLPINKIYFSEPELENQVNGFIKITPLPNEEVKKIAKSQVSQRDFFWIRNSDLVIAWRPFIEQTHHAGVLSELQFAIHNNIQILSYSPLEDGIEHPSPFASMIKKYYNFDEFKEKLNKFINPVHKEIAMENKPPKYCDHTSVGVVIYNQNNEVLLIERGTFPYGMAVPAGHVDDHGTFEEAAIAEVLEEVGLNINELKLIAEGRRENPCRRENGTWHYWKIYEAMANTTELRLSEREAKRAEWCSRDRLIELGLIKESAKRLEKIWFEWFKDLNILPR